MCCRLYDKAGLEVNVLEYVVDMSWKIKSINPVKPLSCMVRQWTRYLWYSIWYIILGKCVSYVIEYIFMYIHLLCVLKSIMIYILL